MVHHTQRNVHEKLGEIDEYLIHIEQDYLTFQQIKALSLKSFCSVNDQEISLIS